MTSYMIARRINREYYKYQLVDWTRPNLTADGTVGGGQYAARANSNYSGHNPYKAFNGTFDTSSSTADMWEESTRTSSGWLEFYSPVLLGNLSFKFTNRFQYVTVWSNFNILVSKDGKIYETLASSITGLPTTSKGTYNYTPSDNTNSKYYCKYIRFQGTGLKGDGDAKASFSEINIYGKQVNILDGSQSDYSYYVDTNKYYGLMNYNKKSYGILK